MKPITYRELTRILSQYGYVLTRNCGGHQIWQSNTGNTVAVPNHRIVSPGVLRTIYKAIGAK